MFVGGSIAALALAASTAGAQETPRPFVAERVSAPRNAVELDVSTGYTQGAGMIQSGLSVPDVVRAGIAVGVGAGYRIDPYWKVGIDGEFQEFTAEQGTGARGLRTQVNAAYHFMPYTRLDPFVQLGTGYRFLWQTNAGTAPTAMLHGLDLARAAVGFDLRVSPDVAFGPVLGADINIFPWQHNSDGTNITLSSPMLNTFVFAGLQGRFDIGGEREGAPIGVLGHR
jgi:hypothetical protein